MPSDNPRPEIIPVVWLPVPRDAPEPPPGRRAEVVMDLLTRKHLVYREDLSRLAKGTLSGDIHVFEPLEPTITEEWLRPYPAGDGVILFYQVNDPERLQPPIEARYLWRPGQLVDGRRIGSGSLVHREGQWCVQWTAQREERP